MFHPDFALPDSLRIGKNKTLPLDTKNPPKTYFSTVKSKRKRAPNLFAVKAEKTAESGKIPVKRIRKSDDSVQYIVLIDGKILLWSLSMDLIDDEISFPHPPNVEVIRLSTKQVESLMI